MQTLCQIILLPSTDICQNNYENTTNHIIIPLYVIITSFFISKNKVYAIKLLYVIKKLYFSMVFSKPINV